MGNLNDQQFLYHGTARDIGERVLPAAVHGGHSYWGSTGTTRDEPARDHAWAHPNEAATWDMALDRANFHLATGSKVAPRARVYAVHQNHQQSPGHDTSIPGEMKAPHYDVAHPIHTMPGRQGTFPDVNWNQHVTHPDGSPRWLPGDEDANHPSHLSVQFGHEHGVYGDVERAVGGLQRKAGEEGTERSIARSEEAQGPLRHDHFERGKDDPLPGMHDPRKFTGR
jgi:hypothetical protein